MLEKSCLQQESLPLRVWTQGKKSLSKTKSSTIKIIQLGRQSKKFETNRKFCCGKSVGRKVYCSLNKENLLFAESSNFEIYFRRKIAVCTSLLYEKIYYTFRQRKFIVCVNWLSAEIYCVSKQRRFIVYKTLVAKDLSRIQYRKVHRQTSRVNLSFLDEQFNSSDYQERIIKYYFLL